MTTIKFGAQGAEVKRLQEALGLTADGEFGQNTLAAVKRFQSSHGLVADGLVGEKTWALLLGDNDLGIVHAHIDKNIVAKQRSNKDIKYLVIHYTAGRTSAKGAAMANRNVFLTRQASADFVVDDETIVQVNPDPRRYYCYAVGDGKGQYGVTNSNCISIEICSTLAKGTSAAMPNHSGWSFTDKALRNAVRLAKKLMKDYEIPASNVIRHYDASRKACPGLVGWNDAALYTTDGKRTSNKNNSVKWYQFIERLK